MSPTEAAHRPEFSVRCACGIEYHTSDTHIGRSLPCKCGRSIKIERPPQPIGAETQRAVNPAPKKKHRSRRRHSSQPSRTYSGNSRFERALNWLSRFAANMLRPLFYGRPIVRVAAFLAWGYLIGVILIWAMLIFTSEHSLPGTLIAYGPRWPALWPLVLLVPLASVASRPTLVPLALAAWICTVPVMGVRFSLSTIFFSEFPATPTPDTFRLLTFNVDGGDRLATVLPEMLREEAPDVITFQECNDDLWAKLDSMKYWHAARHGSLCTGSRWPISAVDLMPRDDFVRLSAEGFGGTALVMRTYIATPRGPLVVVNLHLETARHALEGMMGDEGVLPDDPLSLQGWRNHAPALAIGLNSQRFSRNTDIRRLESERASQWIAGAHRNSPMLIAGDFNMPVESTIFHEYWRQFGDAFEEKGNGLGWSKREGRWLRIRIDHVLNNDAGPKPVRIKLGRSRYSDHLPVVVDLRWPVSNSSPR